MSTAAAPSATRASVPGSTGAVNPALTIAALAERNIEQILRSGA